MAFYKDDTIVAISTPLGEGGIAVIRLSGSEAISIATKVFSGSEDISLSESHRAHHGWIVDKNEPIDEVILTLFRAPHSYTGEDVVEISCHGGIFVSRRIVDLLVKAGARPAEPGEFTQRAFFHKRIDLSQAEAVLDLIHARTEASRRIAAYQLKGGLSQQLKQMRESLIEACSYLEIELDFAEEDIKFISREELAKNLRSIHRRMSELLKTFDRGKACREGIRMVIVGRPNVGKSSILNALLEKERAIVTEIPGTTRDTVEDLLDIEGLLFVVTDTAGIHEARDPVEKEGVQRTKQAIGTADILLLIFDGSEPLTAEDRMIIEQIKNTEKKTLTVINKIDLPQKIDVSELKKLIPKNNLLKLSALTRKGMGNLIQALKQRVFAEGIPESGEIVLTRARHRNSIARAKEYIKNAENSLKKGMSQEFVAMDLRGALDALGEITGETTADDILNHIFSEFCIGK